MPMPNPDSSFTLHEGQSSRAAKWSVDDGGLSLKKKASSYTKLYLYRVLLYIFLSLTKRSAPAAAAANNCLSHARQIAARILSTLDTWVENEGKKRVYFLTLYGRSIDRLEIFHLNNDAVRPPAKSPTVETAVWPSGPSDPPSKAFG